MVLASSSGNALKLKWQCVSPNIKYVFLKCMTFYATWTTMSMDEAPEIPRCDALIMWSTLKTWKNCGVDTFLHDFCCAQKKCHRCINFEDPMSKCYILSWNLWHCLKVASRLHVFHNSHFVDFLEPVYLVPCNDIRELECPTPLKKPLVLQVIHDRIALLVSTSLTLAIKNHGTSRPSQRLVSCGGDHICIFKRWWDDTSHH